MKQFCIYFDWGHINCKRFGKAYRPKLIWLYDENDGIIATIDFKRYKLQYTDTYNNAVYYKLVKRD